MTRQSNNYNRIHIWNPSTGKSFAEDDEKCPLINISLLAGPEDIIYANLQTEGKPCVIDFDLQDNRCWDPFFASPGLKPYDEETLPAPSIQEPILDYKEPNDDLAAILESEILERVKSSIRSWRRIPSSFNNEISYRLRIIIDDLEERKLNGMPPPPSTEYYTPLEGLSLSRGKKMFGFPLHSGFASVTDILDKLHSTAIHESQHPEVEFSAAVRVFPYACDVFSVWVFVCSLVSEY
jgi:coiled-coil and C2 domain-containing protein 2A